MAVVEGAKLAQLVEIFAGLAHHVAQTVGLDGHLLGELLDIVLGKTLSCQV